MVVTHDGQGQNMRARPMAARPAQEEGAIYFLTDVDAPKAEEIRRNDTICLALADNRSRKYVSITGHAEIIDDPGSGQARSGRSTTRRSGLTKTIRA